MKTRTHKILNFVVWAVFFMMFLMFVIVTNWLVRDYNVVEVREPLRILNEGGTISVGDTILIELDYTKNADLEATIFPSINCKTGNLVEFVPFVSNLPIGENVLISDRYVLPPKFLDGEICQFKVTLVYQVNPIKKESYLVVSEFFEVKDINSGRTD